MARRIESPSAACSVDPEFGVQNPEFGIQNSEAGSWKGCGSLVRALSSLVVPESVACLLPDIPEGREADYPGSRKDIGHSGEEGRGFRIPARTPRQKKEPLAKDD